jgi:hypothetical protein
VTSQDEILYNEADDFLILEWFVLVTRVNLDGTLQTVQAVQEGRISDTFLQESCTALSEPFEEILDLESRRYLCETVLSHWLLQNIL